MKYFFSTILFASVLLVVNAQHQCRLCGRYKGYIPPIFVDGADSITLPKYDAFLSSDTLNWEEADIYQRYDYCLYRQYIMLAFLEKHKTIQGDISGTLSIDENGKIDYLYPNSNSTHYSTRKERLIKRVLTSPCFVPAHENKSSRGTFWRYHFSFDAIYRNGIENYDTQTNLCSANKDFELNIYYKKTSLIDIMNIDKTIYTAYCDDPEKSVAFL